MELVRRLSALLIALSLALPQRSCISGGEVEIHYPLSSPDSLLSIIVIAALYSLPLIVLLCWYSYTLAAVVYLFVSLIQLKRALSADVSPKVDSA